MSCSDSIFVQLRPGMSQIGPPESGSDKNNWWLLIGLVVVYGVLFTGARVIRQWVTEGAVDYNVQVPPQLKKDYPWLEDNKQSPSTQEEVQDGKIFPRSPADGRSLGEPIIPLTPKLINVAISSAAAAQAHWAVTTYPERRRVLKTFLKYVLDHQEEIVTACCLDSGKTKIDACFGEILVTVEKLQWTIRHGEKALAPSRRPTNLLMCYKKNTVYHEPLGVVAACVSWNYPFHNLVSPMISALFAGNAIVVKPSEQTAWSSLFFTDIVKGALKACGHSPDLVQNVLCLPDTADYLTSHPGLSHITFIGSRPVALKVAASAAKALTPVTIELGGKDPAIVLDDPKTLRNIDDITAILLRGTFQSAGQNCIGIERVIALPKIHDKILTAVLPRISNLRLGPTVPGHEAPDMGAMVSSRSFDKLESLIRGAVEAGAILHCGGSRHIHPSYPNASYFQPTLISNVTPSMEIAQTELFAPVFLLMKAQIVNHAIDVANSTEYALGANIFGHDDADVRNVSGVSKPEWWQSTTLAVSTRLHAFGGQGGSGYGRFGGEEGLRALCNVKSVCEDAWWARLLGICTRIPAVLQYPITEGERGWEVCCGIVGVGYGLGIAGRVGGLVSLLTGLFLSGEGKRKETTDGQKLE